MFIEVEDDFWAKRKGWGKRPKRNAEWEVRDQHLN